MIGVRKMFAWEWSQRWSFSEASFGEICGTLQLLPAEELRSYVENSETFQSLPAQVSQIPVETLATPPAVETLEESAPRCYQNL